MTMNNTRLPQVAKQAERTIQFFEERGRKIEAVSICGKEFSLTFETQQEQKVQPADLVTME